MGCQVKEKYFGKDKLGLVIGVILSMLPGRRNQTIGVGTFSHDFDVLVSYKLSVHTGACFSNYTEYVLECCYGEKVRRL